MTNFTDQNLDPEGTIKPTDLSQGLEEVLKIEPNNLPDGSLKTRIVMKKGEIVENVYKTPNGELITRSSKPIKTSPVPFDVEEINENITNDAYKLTKDQIINKAIKLHVQGNISEAAKYYQYCINQGFNNEIIFSNYGVILQDIGKFKEAESAYRLAIKVKPNDATAHSNLANLLRRFGKLEEAELSVRKAIELKPDFDGAYDNLGSVLRDLGKLKEGELSYRKAIELNPNFASAHSNLGSILRERGNLKEAESVTRKAIELKPDHAEAHSNLGTILREIGDFPQAAISARKAIELNPNFAVAHLNLGLILKNLGRLEEAELSTRKAIELNPNIVLAYSNLGNILSDLGKLEEAELSIRKAIDLNPDFVDAAWNLYGLANTIKEAEERINLCLKIDKNYLNAKLILSALKLHQGDQSSFEKLMKSPHKDHPFMRSIKWVSSLSNVPELFFHRWALFDSMIKKSKKDRPFYEFGVWRGFSFKYLINTFKQGYGFDTFEGLPEDWHTEKKGTYSADGVIPQINGGIFIEGKFEDTLPSFFEISRPLASIINFDADLYSSTLCALNYAKPVIDKDTILIFDEFIINQNWEEDEYKALNEFCSNNNLTYDVIAISYATKQVAVRLVGI